MEYVKDAGQEEDYRFMMASAAHATMNYLRNFGIVNETTRFNKTTEIDP
tara:strand:+ start:333 stop:479 length:147 start_codon:yes stop_codon:yes gene_type:complete